MLPGVKHMEWAGNRSFYRAGKFIIIKEDKVMNKEQAMDYLKKFRKCVMKGDASFGIDVPYLGRQCQNMHFLQDVSEKSKMIYASYSMNGQNSNRMLSCCRSSERWRLAAFATRDGKVYIYDKYALDLPSGMEPGELPEGIFWFSREMERLKGFIKDVYLPEYFEGLPVEKERYADEASQEKIRKGARSLLLMGRKPECEARCEDMAGEQQAFDHLCGYRHITASARDCLDSIRDELIGFKTRKFLIEDMDPDLATRPWERELAYAVRNADAKQVTVTFMVGSQVEAAKIECRQLLRHLENEDEFCEWDFPTRAAGKKLLSRLGISNSFSSDMRLTCGHIVKAEFRKKALFERNCLI